jgi:uncharacterized protein (DUF433 family)
MQNPELTPNYTIPQTAHLLRIPQATLRTWINSRNNTDPLIQTPAPNQLHFLNLLELHILRALRTTHHLKLSKLRTAINYLRQHYGDDRPLLNQTFHTDGIDLFIHDCGQLLTVSQSGQLSLKDALNLHLDRIETDDRHLPIRLYPFTRPNPRENPKIIAIDPRIAFGQPAIVSIGVPTEAIVARYRAGDSTTDLADDYGCTLTDIEEALRSEMPTAA